MRSMLTPSYISNQFNRLKHWYINYHKPAKKMCLPDFLIIGAQKSGTTSLRYNLNKHPSINMPEREIHYFSNEALWMEKTVNWYMKHFTESDCLQGEKTPEYLCRNKCHQRMYRIVPNAKLIISLRNPVDRAYSQWNHFNQVYERSKQWGWVKTDFETAVMNQSDLLKRGEYIDQIEHLLKFYNREQIYIGIAEIIKQQPDKEFKKIYSFLDIPFMPIEYQNRHVRKYPEPMKGTTRQQLLAHYRPYNDRLINFLGYSVSEWNV